MSIGLPRRGLGMYPEGVPNLVDGFRDEQIFTVGSQKEEDATIYFAFGRAGGTFRGVIEDGKGGDYFGPKFQYSGPRH